MVVVISQFIRLFWFSFHLFGFHRRLIKDSRFEKCLDVLYCQQEPNEPLSDHLEQERRMLEWKLRQQQRQSEEDSRWLAEEEGHLVKMGCPILSFYQLFTRNFLFKSFQRKRLSVTASLSDRSDTDSTDGASAHQKDRSTPIQGNPSDERSVVVKKLEPTPTARLDRTYDKVYDATTYVVRAVMSLSDGVKQAKIDNYVDFVKKVGLELRSLLASVDQLVPHFPSSTHREVSQSILYHILFPLS